MRLSSFVFEREYRMGDPIFFIVLTCLITIPTIKTYSIQNRISNKFDEQSLLFNRTPINSKSTLDKCVSVEAVRQLGCLFIDQNNLHYNVFKSICEQHQLCYACGFVHNITAERCAQLSRKHMHKKCPPSESDCLKARSSILTLLEQDFYRSSEFSFECYDQCLLNYLYSNETK